MMKLSEAIRLGSTLRPQGFGHLKYRDRTCAWGAALDAINMIEKYNKDNTIWPIEKAEVICPHCLQPSDLLSIVIHLNDRCKWSREVIADWVESIENQLLSTNSSNVESTGMDTNKSNDSNNIDRLVAV